jgi:dipeptidyl-peptidase-4
MTDSFPRQHARTRRFSLGAPRSFQVSPDGATVAFLRSRGGSDPVTCLWALDVASGTERLVADPARLGGADREDDALEKARRERAREQASGIVGFATDHDFTVAAFTLAGHVYLASLAGADAGGGADGGPDGGTIRELATRAPAADPRPSPVGTHVAYACDGALRVLDVTTGEDRAIADPVGAPAATGPAPTGPAAAGPAGAGISFGLAEFIAAEEMDRTRGYWWAPDGSAVLVSRVDENPVQRWHIADPANPADPSREVRYPSAGTANAEVTVLIASLAGRLTAVSWDSLAFPYLVTACWDAAADGLQPPLLVVQSRDQREVRLLEVDARTGQTRLLRADTDPCWVDIVPGVPARTADGRIVWTALSGGARRLLVATTEQHAAGTAEPVTPPGLQVREVLDVDGDTVLFTASADDPAVVSLWLAGPDGLTEIRPDEDGPDGGVDGGRRAGGTTVVSSERLHRTGAAVTVRHDGLAGGQSRVIASLAERPDLPRLRPVLSYGGPRRIRTAVLLPSWHTPGSARLPVLCDPYGGPHAQRVLAAGSAFLTSQWLADQGFAVVIADGRGTPGRGPEWDRAVAGDLAGPVLDDQVEAVRAAAEQCGDLDLSRVGIRGWSFGGYLAALAVLRRPDVFHAAVAGAPVTDWRLYDTHYTERYLGLPDEHPPAYERTSLLADAARLSRPLMIIHGLADDNVVVAHSLRLSAALLAAGRPHTVLPLTGVTHMASQEEIAENLLLLQVDFLHRALAQVTPAQGTPAQEALGQGTPPR